MGAIERVNPRGQLSSSSAERTGGAATSDGLASERHRRRDSGHCWLRHRCPPPSAPRFEPMALRLGQDSRDRSLVGQFLLGHLEASSSPFRRLIAIRRVLVMPGGADVVTTVVSKCRQLLMVADGVHRPYSVPAHGLLRRATRTGAYSLRRSCDYPTARHFRCRAALGWARPITMSHDARRETLSAPNF